MSKLYILFLETQIASNLGNKNLIFFSKEKSIKQHFKTHHA